eukprot:CAMPEP_0119136276 /NCGR_PEP_ID=MMETSP1310-20130426/21090_1 /TAXON_ID=464262 /ORGANISM="Genus nov. species nov., Strain RCC2339" /LENGTH=223 /DNA_ID=CAMNT_0007127253 /DNA_START=27 /DNA_END=694 /DNA_ORIENTATION=+
MAGNASEKGKAEDVLGSVDGSAILREPSYTECILCYSTITDVACLVTQPDDGHNVCRHNFCFECLGQALSHKKNCPVCQRQVLKIDRNELANDLLGDLLKRNEVLREMKQAMVKKDGLVKSIREEHGIEMTRWKRENNRLKETSREKTTEIGQLKTQAQDHASRAGRLEKQAADLELELRQVRTAFKKELGELSASLAGAQGTVREQQLELEEWKRTSQEREA